MEIGLFINHDFLIEINLTACASSEMQMMLLRSESNLQIFGEFVDGGQKHTTAVTPTQFRA